MNHMKTFREVLAEIGDENEFRVDLEDGAYITASCCTDDPEVMDWPATFDVVASWSVDGQVGRYDNLHGELEPYIESIIDMISDNLGGRWHYDAADGTIAQIES